MTWGFAAFIAAIVVACLLAGVMVAWSLEPFMARYAPPDRTALRQRILWARDLARANTRPAELTMHLDAALALLDGRDAL